MMSGGESSLKKSQPAEVKVNMSGDEPSPNDEPAC